MRINKTKPSDSARDRLVRELAEHGISYTELPSFLYVVNFRDILAYIKQKYGILYCYRCQRLKHQYELNGDALCFDCKPIKQTWREPIGQVAAKLKYTKEEIAERFLARELGQEISEDGERLYPSNSETPTLSMSQVLEKARSVSNNGIQITEEDKRKALERYNNPQQSPFANADIPRILELRCAGLTIAQMADKLSMGSEYMYQLLNQDGRAMPPAGFQLDWPILA